MINMFEFKIIKKKKKRHNSYNLIEFSPLWEKIMLFVMY